MELSGTRANIVELMIRHEEALRGLYTAYAGRFPEQAQLWMCLADEEAEHAKWLRDLPARARQHRTYLNEPAFLLESVQSSLGYVEYRTAQARQLETSLISALSVALDIENTLIEKRYFELVRGDSVEFKQAMMALAQGTRAHIRRLREAWASARVEAPTSVGRPPTG